MAWIIPIWERTLQEQMKAASREAQQASEQAVAREAEPSAVDAADEDGPAQFMDEGGESEQQPDEDEDHPVQGDCLDGE